MNNNKAVILVIDDEKNIRKMIGMVIADMGHECREAAHPLEAFDLLEKEKVDIILCDIKMPYMDGMECLKKLKTTYKDIPVIMLTGHGSIQTAVEALKIGACDFMEKTSDEDVLKEKVANAIKSREWSLVNYTDDIFDVITDKKTVKILQEAIKIAKTDASVLLLGENGVGKEVLARLIHKHSSYSCGEFVAVNCGAVPESLFESEMIGFEKGAFTGADTMKKGFFERAHKGTLFLDEITDMPMRNQASILRILQEKTIMRLGGKESVLTDFRLITATNKPLPMLAAQGVFREDLYYRINVVQLTLPPLRERKKDIMPLVYHFLSTLCKQYSLDQKSIHPELEKYLLTYPWPGNIRELRNFIERLLIITEGSYLYYDDAHFMHTSLNLDSFLASQEKELLSRIVSLTGNNIERSARILGLKIDDLEKRLENYEIVL